MSDNIRNDDSEKDHPDQIVEPENPLPPAGIDDLSDSQKQACSRIGWKKLMPVQALTIPYFFAGRELMVQSRTGSGKTGAFILPLLDLLDVESKSCQALILVPTRELAHQVAGETKVLTEPAGLRSIAVYGGVSYGPQLEAFRQGAQIVVGTPGRVLDHLLKRSLLLKNLRMLIFDEADRLLSMGFYPDMKELKKHLPRGGYKVSMFSATFPEHVFNLAREFMAKPEFLSLSRDHIHVEETDHVYYFVPAMEKDRALTRIIEMENPESAIIFCNTKAQVHYVNQVLKRFGFDADELSADLSQVARQKVMSRVKKRELRFMVATDVAARGIDISELSHVIQYEPPEDPELYIHRAGRTGRAGATGIAITLVAGIEQIELQKIGKRFDIPLQERHLPGEDDVREVVSERLTALLEAKRRNLDLIEQERLQRFLPLSEELAESKEGLALLAMLIEELYRNTLHTPPPRPEEIEPEKKPSGRHRRKRRKPRPGRKS
jgi:ATP-dependent RNA helicase DeaD